jgi:hypothetical protein
MFSWIGKKKVHRNYKGAGSDIPLPEKALYEEEYFAEGSGRDAGQVGR